MNDFHFIVLIYLNDEDRRKKVVKKFNFFLKIIFYQLQIFNNVIRSIFKITVNLQVGINTIPQSDYVSLSLSQNFDHNPIY